MKKLLTFTLLFTSYLSVSQCDSTLNQLYAYFKDFNGNTLNLNHDHQTSGKYLNLIVDLYKLNKESTYNPNIEQWSYLGKGKITDDKGGFKILVTHPTNYKIKSINPSENIKIEWKIAKKTGLELKMDGKDTVYVGNLKCDKKIGTWRQFYANNKLKNITNYNENSELHGVYKIYHKEGGYLYEEGNYKNGKLEGKVYYYYDNGKVKKEIPFVNGKRNGTVTKYYKNGNIQYIEHYKNGIICCEAKDFYDNGQLKIATNYKNGKLDSSYVFYYENGDLKITQHYKEGKRHGEAILYYDNGQLQEKTSFIEGKFDGSFISYYKNGKLKAKGNYIDGKKIGLWKTYYENGRKKSKGSFEQGVKKGKWIDWDENGKKTKTIYP